MPGTCTTTVRRTTVVSWNKLLNVQTVKSLESWNHVKQNHAKLMAMPVTMIIRCGYSNSTFVKRRCMKYTEATINKILVGWWQSRSGGSWWWWLVPAMAVDRRMDRSTDAARRLDNNLSTSGGAAWQRSVSGCRNDTPTRDDAPPTHRDRQHDRGHNTNYQQSQTSRKFYNWHEYNRIRSPLCPFVCHLPLIVMTFVGHLSVIVEPPYFEFYKKKTVNTIKFNFHSSYLRDTAVYT